MDYDRLKNGRLQPEAFNLAQGNYIIVSVSSSVY